MPPRAVVGTLGLAFALTIGAPPAHADDIPCVIYPAGICAWYSNGVVLESPLSTYDCTSSSHQTIVERGETTTSVPLFETEIVARFAGGRNAYASSLFTLGPPGESLLAEEFAKARAALDRERGWPGGAKDPVLVEVRAVTVSEMRASGVKRRRVWTFPLESQPTWPLEACVGDLGEIGAVPTEMPSGPCPTGAFTIKRVIAFSTGAVFRCSDHVVSQHTHTLTTVFEDVLFTGLLTTEHWEIVDEGGRGAPVRPVPVQVRPRPRTP